VHLDVVVGYDTLNEPHSGFIGVPDLAQIPPHQILRFQITATPFQAIELASGLTKVVDWYDRSWRGPVKNGQVTVNKEKVSAFLPGFSCPWLQHDVWKLEEGSKAKLLKPHYFSVKPDGVTKYDFMSDFWLPFVAAFSSAIRSVDAKTIVFVEPSVMEVPPAFPGSKSYKALEGLDEKALAGPIAYAPHWYDGLTLFNKSFSMFNVDITAIARGASPLTALRVGTAAIRQW